MAGAGCTVPEIVAIAGHSLRDEGRIVDKYLSRSVALAKGFFGTKATGSPPFGIPLLHRTKSPSILSASA